MSTHMYCNDNPMWSGRTLTKVEEEHRIGGLYYHVLFDSHPDANPTTDHWVEAKDCIPIPEVGQTVTVPHINGPTGYDGASCVVTHVEYDSGERKPLITGEFKSVEKPDDTIALAFYEWEPVTTLADVMEPAPDAAALQAEIDRLKQQVESLTNDANHQRAIAADYRSDCEAWNTGILEEAEARSWCDDYERFVDERIRPNMRRYVIEEREQEFEVEVNISGNVYTSYTVNVTARSQEDANEMVKEDPDSFFDPGDVLADHARYNGFDDIEVEVED